MSRRRFLQLLSGSLTLAPALAHAGGGPQPRAKIRAICFDLFTLFDPRGVVTRARALLPATVDADQFCEVWRTRQFEYSWLRAAANQYVDFQRITQDALGYALRSRGVSLDDAAQRALVAAYSELSPYPDTREHLAAFKARGLKLAPLANYSPSMIARLLDQASLTRFFDDQLSTDLARTFKPDPRAYALGPARLGLPKQAIAFSAFGGWDAAGAHWFGFPTFWVNRFGVVPEQLPHGDGTGPSLVELARFISAW